MKLRAAALVIVLLAATATATAAAPGAWLRVASAHFAVVSDGTAAQAGHIAEQMEGMRAVFHALFPGLDLDGGEPLEILALKNRQEFRALLPASYQGKNKVDLAGFFMPAGADGGPDLTLIRLDTGLDPHGDEAHPYAILYHEYTHRLMRGGVNVPLWLEEGLAQFYENTDIAGDDALVAQANAAALAVLRSTDHPLPLRALFAVTPRSTYYHENDRANMFYAESWALTYYFMMRDRRLGERRLDDYLALCAQAVDAVSAARQAFGDLDELQQAFDGFVQRREFTAFEVRLGAAAAVTYTVKAVAAGEADVLEAEVLARNGRPGAARAMRAAAGPTAAAGALAGPAAAGNPEAAALLANLNQASAALDVVEGGGGGRRRPANTAEAAEAITAAEARQQNMQAAVAARQRADAGGGPPPLLADAPQAVERRSVEGTIIAVACTAQGGMDLTLEVGSFDLRLHSDDYHRVPFTPLNFTPAAPLQPCAAARGLSAQIQYETSADPAATGKLIAVGLIQ